MNISDFNDLIINDNRFNMTKKNIIEIKELLFRYVDNCPSKKGPERAKKFKDYNIFHGYDYKCLKKEIYKIINENNYIFFENNNSSSLNYDIIKQKYYNIKSPCIIFAKAEYSEIDSLFKRIRNSFAHGNYFKNKNYYILWNVNRNNCLSSFMKLKYVHLFNIFECLKFKEIR